MRIVGIDPGYAIVGYGAIDFASNRFVTLAYGAVTTPPEMSFEQRLLAIDAEVSDIFSRVRPDVVVVEKLFFNSNQKTAIDVAQARGVIVAAAVRAGIKIAEYTPLQVKLAVVGYGRAEKKQVQEMTRTILGLEKVPRPDDTADALAIAICHAHSAMSQAWEHYTIR